MAEPASTRARRAWPVDGEVTPANGRPGRASAKRWAVDRRPPHHRRRGDQRRFGRQSHDGRHGPRRRHGGDRRGGADGAGGAMGSTATTGRGLTGCAGAAGATGAAGDGGYLQLAGERVARNGSGGHADQDEQRNTGREPARRAPGVCRDAEQPPDPLQQRSAGRREHQIAGCRTQPFELGERRCVRDRVAAQAHGEIVAAVLPLGANPPRQPPHRRVIEQQRFDDGLEEIDDVVVTPDVGELVREDGFHLVRREAGHGAGRQQHDRLQPADDGRHCNARRLQQPDRAADVQPAHQAARGRLQGLRSRARAVRLHPLDPHPPAEQPQRQQHDTREPDRDEHRQPLVDGPDHRTGECGHCLCR